MASRSKSLPLVVGYHQVCMRSFVSTGAVESRPCNQQQNAGSITLGLDRQPYEFVSLDEIGAHFERGKPCSQDL
jgi:hypothetical protein